MLQKESLLKKHYVKTSFAEIPKIFEIALTLMLISYNLGKTKQ